jgi:signal transduction histidine kinase
MPTPSSSGAPRRASRPATLVALAAAAVLLLLVGFAYWLADTQTTSRRSVETRFRDRARVTSALTEALLTSSASSPETSRRFGSGDVSDRDMAFAERSGRLNYAVLIDARGRIIATSPGVTPAAIKRVVRRPAPLAAAMRGTPFTLSDIVHTGPGGGAVVEFAQSLEGTDGRRVLINGISPSLLNAFLGAYLARIPSRVGGTAYVVDSNGAVVGARDPRVNVGEQVAEPGLLRAFQKRSSGSIGQDRYFIAVPVGHAPWRVVLTAPESRLFASVSGARKWVPWIIFAAFGLAALAAVFLLRRALFSASEAARANGRLQEANSQLEANNTLLRRAADLARSNAELEQFASIASHDLQEPLRKVQTFAAQINARERDRLSEQGQDYLRRMSDAASRMRMLIDDLLMFSRVSTQGQQFTRVDLGSVARQVVTDLEVSIEESGATVEISDLPVIDADEPQMGQLLQNLLGNALKFRREGVAPEVAIRAEVVDGHVELTVRDNGIGFDPQYGTRIFRAFERLHGRAAYPGTGIGLALSRKIVERHNGTITAESPSEYGATFTVTLPVEQKTSDSGEARETEPDGELAAAAHG